MKKDRQTRHQREEAFNIHFIPLQSDPRLNFVEHILDVLSESRTGRRRIYRITAVGRWAWVPGLDIALPDSFYDLTKRLRTHARRFFSIARFGCKPFRGIVIRSIMAAEAGPIAADRLSALSPAAFPDFPALLPLPRGSPK